MKVRFVKSVEEDIKYIKVNAGVRYWEDGTIDGEEDISWVDQKNGATPKMPLSVLTENDRYNDYRWIITIDLETGKILDWPEGRTASVHYKICDDGTYTLLDKDMNTIWEGDSYVPDFIGEMGDYLVFSILEDGTIKDFRCSEESLEDLIKNAFD